MFTATGGAPPPPVDPLAGIPFALRLQTHSGFGATPNAPIGLYKPATSGFCTFVVPSLGPLDTQIFTFTIDGNVGAAQEFSFAPSDPGDGSLYLGPGSASAPGTLSAAIGLEMSGQCSNSIDGSTITVTSLTTGVTSTVQLVGSPPITPTDNEAGQDISPATQDGDAICERHDVLGGSGQVASQTNLMLQGTLRFVNGVPVVSEDGSGQSYDLSTPFYPGSNWVCFHVFSKRIAGARAVGLASAGNPYSFIAYFDDNLYASNQVEFIPTPDAATGFAVWTIINNGDVITFRKNGIALTPGSPTLQATSAVWDRLNSRSADSSFSNADFIADLCMASVPDISVVEQVESYLATLIPPP